MSNTKFRASGLWAPTYLGLTFNKLADAAEWSSPKLTLKVKGADDVLEGRREGLDETVPFVTVKAHTQRPIFRGFVVESAIESADSIPELANSIPELADYTTDSVIVGRLPLSNMFNILNPLESADGSRQTIGVGQRQIGIVGMGL